MKSTYPRVPKFEQVNFAIRRPVLELTDFLQRSAARHRDHAGRGNQFWDVLARTGLTPRRLEPKDYADLPTYGIGLTDLAKFESGADAELSSAAPDAGSFRRRIAHFAPRAVAFNGKRAGETFFGRRVDYGRQAESLGKAAIFVLPSTSGAARGFWDESRWQEVARFVRHGETRHA